MSRRPSKFGGRRRDDVRPERKSSVRKQNFDLEDDIFGVPQNGDDDESDLSDLTDEDQGGVGTAPSSSTSARLAHRVGSDNDTDESDGEMAAQILAAGDGESLLGSGESDAEQEDEEEQYIIANARRAKIRQRALQQRRAQRRQQQQESGAAGEGHDPAGDGVVAGTAAENDDALGAFSPETARLLGLPVVQDELFQEQQGFHSDSEPSFSDFFASDHADDDDELTSFDEDEDDTDSDISDLHADLMGEPFLAHVGELADPIAQSQIASLSDAAQANPSAEDGGAVAQSQDIPLLVIEDLDGRLIYARAGDGEAVFGSDGEFEFVDSEDEDDSDDDDSSLLHGRDARWPGRQLPPSRGEHVFDDEDEGDTTDELPDEEMPFPRLLVGSVGPRGGRTSRRARAMAAQMRKLSPHKRGGHARTNSNITDATSVSATSPMSASIDLAPAASLADDGNTEAGPSSQNQASLGLPETPNTRAQSPASVQNEQQQPPQPRAIPSTPVAGGQARMTPTFAEVVSAGGQQEAKQPAMGSFMPSSSKSIHRAVVDGNRKAASPFTSKHSLQRRGLAGRRRPRQSSFSSQSTLKRARREEATGVFPPGEDLVSEATSSPEMLKSNPPLPMDLDDVVDASMLWRSGDSSDGETADHNDSDVSDSTAGQSRRSESKGADCNGPSDGFGLNSSAFSRWRKIPMGAFREQQQGLLSGGGSGSSAGASHHASNGSRRSQQAFAGNYLLQRVSHGGHRRAVDHSPFRRNGNHGSSLHMVVPATAQSPSNPGQAEMIVSPVLWPVHRKSRTTDDLYDDMRPSYSAGASNGTATGGGSARKMTKREKRERKAQRAVARRAAREERQRLRNELSQSNAVEEADNGDANDSGAVDYNTAPSTPRVGTAPAIPDYLSPSKGINMPRLQITEASPRVSPAPQQAADSPKVDGDLDTTHSHESSSVTLSGHTPPTHAVADHTMPSLPSATFGPPLASPLFGGLFAPLNMSSGDEHELELEREGGSALRI